MYNKFSFYSIVVQTVAPEGSSATRMNTITMQCQPQFRKKEKLIAKWKDIKEI